MHRFHGLGANALPGITGLRPPRRLDASRGRSGGANALPGITGLRPRCCSPRPPCCCSWRERSPGHHGIETARPPPGGPGPARWRERSPGHHGIETREQVLLLLPQLRGANALPGITGLRRDWAAAARVARFMGRERSPGHHGIETVPPHQPEAGVQDGRERSPGHHGIETCTCSIGPGFAARPGANALPGITGLRQHLLPADDLGGTSARTLSRASRD